MAVTLSEIAKLFEGYKKEFELMLKQQEKVFIDIISGNLKIFNGRLEKVEKDIEELKHSLNYYEELIDEKVKKANVFSKEDNSEITRIQKKLREIEDRSRRNNLKVDGINKNEGESWKESELKVKKVFEELLSVKNVQIERAHRTGKKEPNKPRTIVIKLLDFKDKVAILSKSSNLKGKNIYINEDFCSETTQIRKGLREKMKIERAAGKFAFISYDKLIIRDWVAKKSKNSSS
ncbi:uncharacterized protein LOC136085270 [Hydra vulgaris]|uniref:uncharacterized protein LOC136085270 n=1 Tax=Hydra vulgaris TaxID=6087 RepID=UPI0032EA0AEA